jgi:hypothetical protein
VCSFLFFFLFDQQELRFACPVMYLTLEMLLIMKMSIIVCHALLGKFTKPQFACRS